MQETRYNIRDERAKEASAQAHAEACSISLLVCASSLIMQDEQLKLSRSKRPIDLQKEYWRLQESEAWGDWENKRVERPPEDEPVFDRK
ncbi:hypothetical protein EV182_006935 [Spiromyces aspiralis]|uniref:Uncharacterized protein n=1 Tax=Spiromyces aspiralis TaxID=68401 RepID=A0ACC1H8J9_9FUNG|nr:hypothetical protein EV182_006935 [Spiromyces aspiralis]